MLVKFAVTKDAPTMQRWEVFALDTEPCFLLVNYAVTKDAPTMQRWEVFALGTEPRTQTKIAAVKDVPTM